MKNILYVISAKLYKNTYSDIRGYTSIVVGFFSYLLSSGIIALSIIFSDFALPQKINNIGNILFPSFTNLQLTLLVGHSRPTNNMEIIQLSLSYFLTFQIFQVLLIAFLVFLGSLLFKANFIKAFLFAITIVLAEILLSVFFGQIL